MPHFEITSFELFDLIARWWVVGIKPRSLGYVSRFPHAHSPSCFLMQGHVINHFLAINLLIDHYNFLALY